ncbi:MAG TPA: TCP-1/cpn60 chaperonin family protein [Armatimonadota bacterium]|nr:TCP-1/cpn60 chaperonin family protein [Armatimonadota bacterium]
MSDQSRQINKGSDVDERLAALLANAGAIRTVAAAVEGTIGPKGLNCMLVDRFGDVIITNDGSAILDKIDVTHPASRMLINTAKAQDDEVGDGTTTATVLASALISEGTNQVVRGVPVTKVIEGIRLGVSEAVSYITEQAKQISDFDNPLLMQTALVSARGQNDLAELSVKAAKLVGLDKLADPAFRLADAVVSKEGAKNEVFAGLIIDKERMSRQMPRSVEDVKVLVVDDAIEPEHIEEDALSTEAGFARYMSLQAEFRENLKKIVELGVRFVVAAKAIDDSAEELFTDAGILAVRRLSSRDISRLIDHTGARPIKRSGLKKEPDELAKFLGRCDRVYEDEQLGHIRVVGGAGKPAATILVGASTQEVKEERDRIAKDATSAVQAALLSGVVAGGGAVELAAARKVSNLRQGVRGMAAYGVDCVAEALKRPLMQIVANAGFNPLEKVEDAAAAQSQQDSASLAIDCDTGDVADMFNLGVTDPAKVKLYAIKAAAEVAEAVLRINVIIRKRDDGSAPRSE